MHSYHLAFLIADSPPQSQVPLRRALEHDMSRFLVLSLTALPLMLVAFSVFADDLQARESSLQVCNQSKVRVQSNPSYGGHEGETLANSELDRHPGRILHVLRRPNTREAGRERYAFLSWNCIQRFHGRGGRLRRRRLKYGSSINGGSGSGGLPMRKRP